MFLRLAIFALFFTSISTPLYSQALGDKFRARSLPYPSDGVKIGQGWDDFLDQRVDGSCVDVIEAPIEKTLFQGRATEVRNSYSLREKAGQSVSGSYSGYGISASASYSQSSSSGINTDYLNYLFVYEINSGSTFAAGVPEGDISSWKMKEEVKSRRFREHSVKLSAAALSLLSDKENGLELFRQKCGDSFVNAIHRGSRINVLATYKSTSKAAQNELRASISASGFGGSISAALSKEKAENKTDSDFSFQIFQEGGIPAKIPEKFEDVKDSIDVVEAFQNPTAFQISVTPYSVLPSWPGAKDMQLPQALNELAAYYLILSDIFNLLHSIETSYLVQSLSITVDENAPGNRLIKQYPMDNILINGGFENIQNIKGKVHRYMAYLEGIIDTCYIERQCDQAKAIKTYSSRLIRQLETARATLTKQSASPPTDGNDLSKLLNETSTFGELKALSAKIQEPEIDQMQAINSRQIQLEIERLLDWEIANESNLKREGTGAFSDDFFVDFYRILAQVPLPLSRFNIEWVKPDKDATVWFKKEIKKEGDEAGIDYEKQNKLAASYIREVIYFNRLRDWNAEFCGGIKSRKLCRSDIELRAIAAAVPINIDIEQFPVSVQIEVLVPKPAPKAPVPIPSVDPCKWTKNLHCK